VKGILAVLLGALIALSAAAAYAAADDVDALKGEVKKLQDRIDKLEAAKAEAEPTVTAKTGNIKIGALLQQWYISTNQKEPESEYEGYGRSEIYSNYYNNTFHTRRARLNLGGDVSEDVGWYTQFEFARKDQDSESYSGTLLDMWLNYRLDENDRLTVGQFKVPFGYETLVSASDLETVERAMVFSNAKIGDFWDVGAQYVGTFDSTEVRLAIVQGEGQSKHDADDRLDVCARVNVKPQMLPGLEIGGSVYSGKDDKANENRSYWGGHVVYTADRFHFMGEYATGNTSNDLTIDSIGWYALASYAFTPEVSFVARYEEFDPDDNTSGDKIKATTAGLNYYINKQNAKIQANYVRYDPAYGDTINDIIINFQVKV
jgi:phosphate-selective porin OprO/OprP